MRQMLIFFIFLFSLSVFSEDKSKNFFMGSIVKSDEWEIDRKKNMEYFKKNVYFKNFYYNMKSDYAVYDRNNKIWNTEGNVYCKKKFDDSSYIEIFCDSSRYLENYQKAETFSSTRVKMIYYDVSRKEQYVAYSKKTEADNNYKKIYFYKNFELKISSINAYSDYSVYDDMNKTFELTENPYATGFDNKYKIYIQAENMKINRTDMKVYAEKNVFGVIKLKDMEINKWK